MSLYDKNIGKEKRASLEFAEDSRETEWLHPSYSALLYQGQVKWELLHPFPRQSAEDKKQETNLSPDLKPSLRNITTRTKSTGRAKFRTKL